MDCNLRYTVVSPMPSPRRRNSSCSSCAERNSSRFSSKSQTAAPCRVARMPGMPGGLQSAPAPFTGIRAPAAWRAAPDDGSERGRTPTGRRRKWRISIVLPGASSSCAEDRNLNENGFHLRRTVSCAVAHVNASCRSAGAFSEGHTGSRREPTATECGPPVAELCRPVARRSRPRRPPCPGRARPGARGRRRESPAA